MPRTLWLLPLLLVAVLSAGAVAFHGRGRTTRSPDRVAEEAPGEQSAGDGSAAEVRRYERLVV